MLEKEVLDKKQIEEILGGKPIIENNGNGQVIKEEKKTEVVAIVGSGDERRD